MRHTLCNTMATHGVQLTDPVGSAALAGIVEDKSRHACLDETWAKRIDPDVGALELPCSRLRDRIHAA